MEPVPPMRVDSFVQVFAFEHESVPVVLYRCCQTGLRLAVARVQSPTVHGYFAAQTEAFDDFGCPHTLEHLIFLGSQHYPYKGVLDVLANRCFAQGTNAWTDTDHTCYTVDTAGSEGFLRILPVYLDHVLFPTLKESGFVTEVHHVTAEGEDAGVVYCEMQARENEAADMMDYAMRQAIYPGKCSYKSETGGRLKELRELSNGTVQEYHAAYYRPENLCVFVTGVINYTELCQAVAPVVQSILANDKMKALPPFERPFALSVPIPETPTQKRIEFPAEDESSGAVVKFAWSGPAWLDLETITALDMLLTYVTQDAIAPLRKVLVETLPPLCGRIDFAMSEQTTYLMYLTLKSVDCEQLKSRDVDAEVSATLRTVADESGVGIDVERMKSLIRQRRRSHHSDMESSPHDAYSGQLIGAFLYAPGFAPNAKMGDESAESLKQRLDLATCLNLLLEWPATKWAALCDRWLTGASSCPRVTVVGTPSKAFGELIQSEETARVAAQKEKLGEEGRKQAGELLEAAEVENEADIPESLVQQFKLPDAAKIDLINVSSISVCQGRAEPLIGSDAAQICEHLLDSSADAGLPTLSFQFNHATGAQFVTCSLLLLTDALTVQQLELLPLWLHVAFEMPLAASSLGPAMPYEAVVRALTDVTVEKDMDVHTNAVITRIKVERERYAEAPLWIARILADAQFAVERLKVAAQRILNDVPNIKRKGRELMNLAMEALKFQDESMRAAKNVFRTERVLKALLESDGGMEQASTELTTIRGILLNNASAAFANVAGDVKYLGDVFSPWRIAPFQCETIHTNPATLPVLERNMFAKDLYCADAGCVGGCLVSSSAEESNYWIVQCKGISDPRSPDLAALLVAMEYCCALEGPFWCKIRGRGLAYGYSMSNDLEQGIIRFRLSKATDPTAAFKVAKDIVLKLCGELPSTLCAAASAEGNTDSALQQEDDEEEEVGLELSALEGAQSGVLFELISEVDTVPAALSEALDYMLTRKPMDQLQWLLKEVQAVTIDTVKAALIRYVLPVFTCSNGSVVSAVCPAKKREQIEEEFSKLNPPFKLLTLEVDDLIQAVAPDTGYFTLRERVKAACGRPQ